MILFIRFNTSLPRKCYFLFFQFLMIFLMWTIFKVFIELIEEQCCFCFMFWFFFLAERHVGC